MITQKMKTHAKNGITNLSQFPKSSEKFEKNFYFLLKL